MENYNRIKERTRGALILLPFVLIGALVLYTLQQCDAHKANKQDIRQTTDTIFVHDTIELAPRLQVVRTLRTDTVFVRDTHNIFVPTLITCNDYHFTADTVTERNDTIKVDARLTGTNVELRKLTIDYTHKDIATTTTISTKPKPKRWGIGLQLGAGAAMCDKKIIVSPYIGVGISYNIFTF